MSVKLKLGYTVFDPKKGMGSAKTVLKVKVKNISPDKNVQVSSKGDAYKWYAQPLTLEKSYGSYDIFTNELPEKDVHAPEINSQFVLKSIIANQEYWDNNHSNNYQLPYFRATVGNNISLIKAQNVVDYQNSLSYLLGTIYVNDICFTKTVGILYSTDGGWNWRRKEAYRIGKPKIGPMGEIEGIEEWAFETEKYPIETMPPIYMFSAYFEVNDENHPAYGDSFWDNNFSLNYVIGKNYPSVIE